MKYQRCREALDAGFNWPIYRRDLGHSAIHDFSTRQMKWNGAPANV
jgi:hypothetical protein